MCGSSDSRNRREGCVIGAGSVIIRDIPPYSLAAGNPCRVIRKITEKDHMPDGIEKNWKLQVWKIEKS